MLSLHRLHIYEEVLLLSLHDTRGTSVSMVDPTFAIAGAMLVELALANRIELGGPKKNQVLVRDERLFGDHILDAWFDKIRRRSKPRSVGNWVLEMSPDASLREKLIQRLWLAGHLRREEKPLLLFFSRDVYPLQISRPKDDLKARIRDALASDQPVDARTAAATLLVWRAGLLDHAVGAAQRKRGKARLNQFEKGLGVIDRADAVLLAAQAKPGK